MVHVKKIMGVFILKVKNLNTISDQILRENIRNDE